MTEPTTQLSYDQVPYPSLSYAQSHPDRLATLATLLGMRSAPVERCRVLELGCAGGGNLIPMAYGLPESTFVGIDSSTTQITEAQAAAERLGLENVKFECRDILDVRPDLGQFDYIIAHGVFSWVPEPVQEKLLDICSKNLAPNGVAYVSYNAYPGWHMLSIIREMMLYHTRDTADPQLRATQARALLDFLAESVPAENSAYGSFLKMYAGLLDGELKGADRRGDAFLLHDELEEVNEPIYFFQFAERAACHGMQYLGDAVLTTMLDTSFPTQVSAKLRELSSSAVELEQYMDWLRNRTFRQTLLCHQKVVLSRSLNPARMGAFRVASCARPETSDLDIRARSVTKFRASDGAVLSTDHPVTKAAMLCLAQLWPGSVPFADLLSLARSRLASDAQECHSTDAREEPTLQPPGSKGTADDALVLGTNLLKAVTYSGNLMELHVHTPRMALRVSERPIASSVARLQARSSDKVTNLRHERVSLDQLDRYLLSHLDGSHDLAALVETLVTGPVASGALAIRQDDQSTAKGTDIREILAQDVTQRLRWLARAALLVG